MDGSVFQWVVVIVGGMIVWLLFGITNEIGRRFAALQDRLDSIEEMMRSDRESRENEERRRSLDFEP